MAESKIEVKNIEAPPPGQPNNPYTEALVLSEHKDIVRLLYRLDQHRCISAGEDGLAVIWDIKTGMVVHKLQGHCRPITCVLVLHNKGEILLLTAASDKRIYVWNTDTGQNIQQITEHGSSVRCLVELPDLAVFCSGGEKLCLWNNNGKLLHCMERKPDDADIHLMITIKNSKLITASDKDIVVYGVVSTSGDFKKSELRLVKNVPHNREPIRSLVNISDSCFASGSLDGAIIVWSTQTMTPTRILNSVQNYIGEEKLYPYSVQCLVIVEERFIFAAVGCGYCGFDILTGKTVVEKQNAHYSKVLGLGFVLDGQFLATCSEDGTIRLWGMGQNDVRQNDVMMNLVGQSFEDVRHYKHLPLSPPLIGDLMGHSGPVQMFLDYGMNGLFSCSGDGLVISWKNAVIQSLQRQQLLSQVYSSDLMD